MSHRERPCLSTYTPPYESTELFLSSSAAAVLMHGSLPVPEFSCFQYGYHWTWTVVAAPAAAAAAAHI